MRPIKYEAWHKILNEMAAVTRIDFDGDGLPETIYLYEALSWTEGEGGITCADAKSVILRQHTGLDDKYGKEIYEGDVIQVRDAPRVEDKLVREVFFQNGVFQISNTNEGEDYLVGDFCMYSHVIGNIYENPELTNGGEGRKNEA